MTEKLKINDGHYIELMDRLHILMSNLNEHIIHHPIVALTDDSEMSNKLDHAMELLWETYQRVGSATLNK